ncbi:VanZ family protein [Olsenella sp. Marseille-P4559]|jgi:VanZ family protein|uniref:VanZ family protein n=1 Tax=Olsenella sp. Marseille-P4559 TaxID=2364795 RepID=UPI0010317A8D|nr:VanZ family protein [Olsenella sp. Marseille-P4559]
MRDGMGESSDSAKERLGSSARHRWWALGFCLWVAFIWGHSLVQGPQSSAESAGVVAQVTPLLNALGITSEHAMTLAVRKTAHFLEYAVLGALAVPTLGLPARGGRAPRWLGPVAVALIPVVDETIQHFVPGREPSPCDVLIDLCGIAAGALVALLASRRRADRRTVGGATCPK